MSAFYRPNVRAAIDSTLAEASRRALNDPEVLAKNIPGCNAVRRHYVLSVEGQGSIGFMKGIASFDFEPKGETLLRYAGSAELGGAVAGVGQRVLSGVAKFLVGRFFKGLEKCIEEAKGATQ